MDRSPRTTQTASRPLERGRAAPTTTPMLDTIEYRPGPYFALIALLAPVLVALGGAAIALNTMGTVPLWLPFVVLLWAPLLPVMWFAMQSVRTSPAGLAVGRPWRAWAEIGWDDIERVERVGPVLRITASDGRRLSFLPGLLHEGARLQRQFLLHLPQQVFFGTLARKSRDLVADRFSGVLRGRPAKGWRVVTGACCVVGLLVGAIALSGLTSLPREIGVIPAVPALLAAAIMGAALWWLSQEVALDESGITVQHWLRRGGWTVLWDDVQLLEHTPDQGLLRLHGPRRFVCMGPGLLPPAERDLMRAFIHEYCVKRGVAVVRRRWIWPR